VSKKIGFYTNFRLIHASVNKFWDRVPIGRVINKLTSDSSEVDNSIPDTQNHCIEVIGNAARMVIISTVALNPLLWVFIIAYFFICYKLYNFWVYAVRMGHFLERKIGSVKNQLIRESFNSLTEIRVFCNQKSI